MGDLEHVKALLQSVHTIIDDNNQKDRANGELFNFFEVCKIQTKEIRHSMFIAELLNPKGSHGQGDVFLKEFLAVLGTKENAPDEEILSRFSSKKTTVWTEFRSIDISLYTDSDVIIIENKINALTRPGQLFDYVNKWKDGDWKKNVRAVVYLTPNGREPEKDSLIPNPQRDIDEDTEINPKPLLVCMSYQYDIIDWLEKCINNIGNKNGRLYMCLEQYLECVRIITNRARSWRMNKEILEQIIASKQSFKAAEMIVSEFNPKSISSLWTDRIDEAIAKGHKLVIAGERDEVHVEFPVNVFCKLWLFNNMDIGIWFTDGPRKPGDENKIRVDVGLDKIIGFDLEMDKVPTEVEPKWHWLASPSTYAKYKLLMDASFPDNIQKIADEFKRIL